MTIITVLTCCMQAVSNILECSMLALNKVSTCFLNTLFNLTSDILYMVCVNKMHMWYRKLHFFLQRAVLEFVHRNADFISGESFFYKYGPNSG